jgi:hypothetical protein
VSRIIACFLRLIPIVLLVAALAACQISSAPVPTPAAGSVAAPSTGTPPAAAISVPVVAPTHAPVAATIVSASATPAVDAAPEQAVQDALLAQYPSASIRIQCVEREFAAAAVAPLSGQHGFDAFLQQQNGAWAIRTNGVDISRETLLALGFPGDFCGMPSAGNPPPAVPNSSAPLIGPEWTPLTTGDFDRNGREDVIAFKPAPIIPGEPDPGSQPNDVFIAFSELAVVERAADGAPAVRVFMDKHTVLADNQAIAQMPSANRPTSGVLAELRYPDRSFELRLIDDTGALGLPFLIVRFHEDTGAYAAEATDTNRMPLNIGALTISPSEPAPDGPESGPSGRQLQAGAIVTLNVPVQGARQVRFFADALGQNGNGIGSSTDVSADRGEITWTVPSGAGQLTVYAQALDGIGGMITSAQVPVVIKAPVSSEYELPEALLRAYYQAINGKDYARAYGYWENPPNPTLEEFAQGYGDTASVAAALGQPTLQGAAGNQYARIPIVLAATSTAGHLMMFSGCYVARQTNADIDTSSRGSKWLLSSAAVEVAPTNVTTKQLLAQGCQQ